MSVQKKTHNKKKKKDKPSKAKPKSAHSKLSKNSKHKDSKGKKLKKHSKGHVKGAHKKKRSKPSKSKIPSTEPADGPFTAVPPKKKKKEKKVKKSKSKIEKREEPGKVKVAPVVEQPIGQGGSGSLKLEKTQMSDESIRRKKEKEEKKKKKEMEEEKKKKKKEKEKKEEAKKDKKGSDEKEKEPKVKPVAPTRSPKKKSPPPAADKKVSNLYKIVGEISDTKSSLENKSPPKKEAVTPEAKTPETEGPPLEKKASPKYERPKEEPKEGTGYNDEMKLESERDNLDDKPADAPPVVVNKDSSGSKKKKKSEESLKLNKTQSLSPVNIAAPIEPGPPGKQYVKPDPDPNNEIVMETPPLDPPPQIEEEKEKSDRVRIIEPQRSEIEQPIQEPEFVEHHGDTRVRKMEIKKVDLDLIGRTGMYMERFGMSAERKSSFDWIAYNRHDMKNKQKDFSKHMATALSDIGIQKELLMRTVVYLKSHGQITPSEMDKVLQEIQGMKGHIISFTQASQFLRNHCETYKNAPSKETVRD